MNCMSEMVFDCEKNLELILVYSLLSKNEVKVAVKRRQKMAKSFAKLLQKISHGSAYSVSEGYVTFTPGSLKGGEVAIQCEEEISMYIEPILVLCPFVIEPLKIKFKGITNGKLCVDLIRIAHFGVLRGFGVKECEIVVKKRGFGPIGKGEVVFTVGSPGKISTIVLEKPEKIVKVRGLVVSSRVSSIPVKEMTETIKELMGDVSNTKVFSNMSNRLDSGPSPGFQCAVFAESKNGVYYSVMSGEKLTPRETATAACKELLLSIRHGGVFDKKLLYLALSLMSLSSTSIGSLWVGKVDSDVKVILDLLKQFFGFEYEVRRSGDGDVVYGAGCGLSRISRQLK
ncbi:RNA 3'-terminal phosphate cyclase [Encephalitozoon hellem ATCC 50504]|uniref:RNA 3'-terminal phosphate cyclase-like protein n=1 Tax=Encephalitozoon hellem TaxID=27973 RepID=A0A9Q9CAL7_ENCHE|nr:RNA 3'-terminal phosphate cyclase [Encephalitozoon hellem ATCC 50504]AFM98468.1 RNA 3'-terminal phosphate cyclase [Encephalitozoon hellem ATCC 50504]UTX43393.1 RNA 3'-terminal phosphate cyclase-like protein [Encephalitozoon hellem]WEL38857.1 RNA 3'-terminal phosphate cyclase-like protein [Encephalitozoon hellem]|eukprot:XP_003887449.1 RNA 3'-terminal phosphate cyclase [Encephalitozoon hellem ATCC 50504]